MRLVINLEKSIRSGGGRWVTIKKDGPLKGRHVFIDGSGQITKGKGIPAHVIHHLNSAAGKHHLEGAEDHDPVSPELQRAKDLAADHPNHEKWNEDLLFNHSKEFDAVLEHMKRSGKSLEDLFKEFGGGRNAARLEQAKRAKAAAEKKARRAQLGHAHPEDLPERAEKALQEQERNIRHKTTEEGTLHHPETGETLWGEDQGHESQVDLSDAVRKGLVRGNVLTHNHPQGHSFSPADVRLMLAQGLKEIRAVSKKHLHRIQPPEDYKDTEQSFEDMQQKLDSIEQGIRSEFWDRINSGKMTPDEASAQHFHELWTRAAKQLGFKYERSEHSD